MSKPEKKTILLVEDEVIIALAQSMIIREFGYEVITASSGKEAIQTAVDNRAIDLILMDIDLGKGISGPETAGQILALRNIPIVFLTSHSEKEYVDKVKEITRYGYVIKNSGNFVLQSSIEMAFELFNANTNIQKNMNDLKRSEEKYNLLADNISDVLWILDIESERWIYMSPSIERLRGYTIEEAMAQPLKDIMTTESYAILRKKFEDRLKRVIEDFKEGVTYTDEFEQICKDGSTVWTEAVSRLITNEQGKLNLIGITRDIRERKRAEKRAIKSQALYYSLVDQLPAGVFRKDIEGCYVYVSPWFCRLKKMDAEEFLGKTPEEVAASATAKQGVEGFAVKYAASGTDHHTLIMQNGKPIEVEEEYADADGKKIFVSVKKIPVFDSNEKIIGTQGIMFDITDHKNTEEALRIKNEELAATNLELTSMNEEFEAINDEVLSATLELQKSHDALQASEEKFKNIFEYSSVGKSITSVDGTLKPNRAFCQLLGYTETELMEKTWQEITYPDDIAKNQQTLDLIRSGEIKSAQWQKRYIHKKGNLVWVDINTALHRDKNNTPLYFITTIIDITERKIMEEALREGEEKYRGLINLAVDGILVGSREGIIIEANECICEMAGIKREDLIGKSIQNILFTKESLDSTPLRFDLLQKGETVVSERIIRRPDGSEIIVEMRSKMMPDGTYQSIYRDVTKRTQSEEKIKALLAEKELFIKEVHHRIKNNMSTVVSLLALQSSTLTDPSAIEALMLAKSRVQSMMMLYDKLYRSEDFTQMSVKEYISPLIEEIADNFPNRESVTIEKNIDDFILETKIFFPLGIIVNELITNAMKYSFVGKERGLIKISASCKNNHAFLTVEDNGIGLPSSIDVKNSTGFGLKLVGILAHQIGGTIKIERKNGTKFILEFSL